MRLRGSRLFLSTLVTLGCITSACGGDSTAGTTGGIPVSSVTGTWSLTLGDSLPCSDSVPARDFSMLFTGTDDDVEPAGSLTFAESWSTGSGLTGELYGTVNVQSRLVVLHLTRQDSLDYGMEVRGILDDDLVLNGFATDPYPGFQPLLVAATCTFNARATRISP